MIEKIPHTIGNQIFPFEIWFRYRLGYRQKLSTNLGFGIGIGPKPKQWFRSYTRILYLGWFWPLGQFKIHHFLFILILCSIQFSIRKKDNDDVVNISYLVLLTQLSTGLSKYVYIMTLLAYRVKAFLPMNTFAA